MDFFKKIAIGVIVGLVLMLSRKYLFLNVRAETISITNPSYIKYKNMSDQNNYYLCGNGCTGTYTFTYFDNTYYGLGSAGSEEWWYGIYYSYDNHNFPTGNYTLQFNLRMQTALRNADGVNVSVLDSSGHVYYCYTNASGMNYMYNNDLVLSNGDTFYQGNGIMGVYCPNVDLNSNLHYAILVNAYLHLTPTNSFGISKISLVKENDAVVNAIDAINDTDISSSSKESVDDTEMNNYSSKESDLFDSTDSNYSVEDTLDVGLDANGSQFLWDTITRFIHTHAKVFGCVISMLSLGIIKLILGR